MKKKIIILGSTGSIGQNTLRIAELNAYKIEIFAITGYKNIHLFIDQILKFRPKYAILEDEVLASMIKTKTNHVGTTILSGKNAYHNLANEIDKVDFLMSAISGTAGILSTMELLPKCRILCIANKESIILAGEHIIEKAKEFNVKIVPVDSEHNATIQIMKNVNKDNIEKLILTASGGMLLNKSINDLKNVTFKDINQHPNWNMGSKINIDCSSMANKALELIEANILFDLSYKKLDAIIHPQSIIHSILEMKDKSMTTYMSQPNMQLYIKNAIFEEENVKTDMQKIDLIDIKNLTFQDIDHEKFKSFYLGKFALKKGRKEQIIFNAANEIATKKFMQNEINFLDISRIIEECLSKDYSINISTLESKMELNGMILKHKS